MQRNRPLAFTAAPPGGPAGLLPDSSILTIPFHLSILTATTIFSTTHRPCPMLHQPLRITDLIFAKSLKFDSSLASPPCLNSFAAYILMDCLFSSSSPAHRRQRN
ncbi:hypothetical protein SLEP1_g41394 [Rubroshorea leprosula]|uniref:Uncharacterized protein n=1 Tax=Rubroshorea leprosula TaxID=152421 RepID=A0AAV5L6Q0_9ROSI|nr:hypothetical protein SLEP1_g41394 [Rubroshorea leprosula]